MEKSDITRHISMTEGSIPSSSSKSFSQIDWPRK